MQITCNAQGGSCKRVWPGQYLPEFLRKTGHEEPSDGRDCAFDMAFRTNEPLFDFLTKNPKFLETFNSYMTSQRQGRQSWLEFFPLERELVTGFSTEDNAVMFVDVGGGYGIRFKRSRRGILISPDA